MELRRADEAGHCRRRLPAASVTVTHLTQQPAMLGRFRGAPAGFGRCPTGTAAQTQY
jgi:hypothetical protein